MSRTNIVEHIGHIYEENELDADSTCRKFRQVQIEESRKVNRQIPFYNLDMILSLGYRVKSAVATKFRRWANQVLKVKLSILSQKHLRRVENETVWLTQAQMAELFGTAPQNITIHIKNIYEEGELFKVATCKDFLQVARKGNRDVKRSYKYYNLDVIISVGYRVKFYQTNPLHRSNLNTCRL